jgi:hypothetical protein
MNVRLECTLHLLHLNSLNVLDLGGFGGLSRFSLNCLYIGLNRFDALMH